MQLVFFLLLVAVEFWVVEVVCDESIAGKRKCPGGLVFFEVRLG
jgi:hypothetical protein